MEMVESLDKQASRRALVGFYVERYGKDFEAFSHSLSSFLAFQHGTGSI
jgi:hypothetical protein